MVCRRLLSLLPLVVAAAVVHCPRAIGQTNSITTVWNKELAEQAAAMFQQLPAVTLHEAGLSQNDLLQGRQSDHNYQELVRAKLEKKWFAALVASEGQGAYSIQRSFASWRELVEFLAENRAVVDVWAYTSQSKPRRIPAPELAELKHRSREQPTLLTVTYPDQQTGKALEYQLEFSFRAAEEEWSSVQAYQRHRSLEETARQILGTRNANGIPDAIAQWTVLENEIRQHKFTLRDPPGLPTDPKDLFVAFEFEVDDQNNFLNAVGIYRDSEIEKRVIGDVQVLYLRKAGGTSGQQVVGFRRTGFSDHLEPATNAILGQDVVELRVKNPAQPDPNKWNVIEFGEPELLKESALAHFAQLNAYLEKKRKAQAMKQANLALVAEPIIAGLNIGGGLGALGFPAGDAARLLYNLISWTLISDVPSARQMKQLFALMAARDRNPEIKTKPEKYLTAADIHTLKQAASKLSDQEVQTYLERMSEDDVRAMLRLAQQGMIDARVTTFLNTLTSAFKLSGLSDEAGPIRNIFNNVRFSMNGDINISTLLLLALGHEDLTTLSGVSLRQLSQGEGPNKAWLQFLVISVDIRAVLNTLVRLTKGTEAKKELEKPFAYSPRMDELAAYEVRVFGFPLLMFYKRGLIKADQEAYEQDYAYGLRGVRLVEHFPTRESMEAEIRAGRMYPLGLVKVPAPGGWKETDLVVYAHRMDSGKGRGKTSLVIYGLKAYAEYSELIGRELIRFKQFERGQREGAVIEQPLWEQQATVPSRSFEPVIHVGSNTVQEFYNPLLGNLLELRRFHWRQQWGLPTEESDLQQARQRLAALGVEVEGADPLVEVDAHNSSFIYRRKIDGRTQNVQITSVPSSDDIKSAVRKSEEAREVERIRAEAAAGKSSGVVLLNEAISSKNGFEVGPLLRDTQGQIAGTGLITGARPIAEILEQISRLPVTERVRLQANRFAASLIDHEFEGQKTKVFLTVEFPLGETRQELTNLLTGELETLVYSNGLWLKTITDSRVLELQYDSAQVETGSRTYANLGDRLHPAPGVLLEQTKTLECWLRDLRKQNLDPYEPLIRKLRVNYITGQVTREDYGLFSLPIETADDQYVTRNRYTRYGFFESAMVFDNGQQVADFQRPAQSRVLEPILGSQRFQLNSQLPDNADLPDLSTSGFRSVVLRTDLLKGLARTETFDNAHFGRKVREENSDPFDGTRSFSYVVTWDYSNNAHFGLVPTRSLVTSAVGGAVLSEITTTAYDPVQRRLTGTEISHTGRAQTNLWDYRWSAPVQSESPARRITQEFNRQETSTHALTIAKSSGETLEQSDGVYDAATKTWRVRRQFWYGPAIPGRVDTNTYSASGMLIRSRSGTILESRPNYNADGIEVASETYGRNGTEERYDVLTRRRDQYQWQNGRCDARVQIFVNGAVVDQYRAINDEYARTVQDGIRTWPGLELKTVLRYDADTERVVQAEALQNGQVRATYQPLGASKQPGGDRLLKVQVTPYWGLTFTNSYSLSDPLARLIETEFENHDRARVTDWFSNTAIARISELVDRHGHIKERFVKRLNANSSGSLPLDLVIRYRISPWQQEGWAEEKAVARGTDVPVYAENLGQRIYFDWTKVYDAPQYAIDPHGYFGLRVSVGGIPQSNVTAVFSTQLRDWPPVKGAATVQEPQLEVVEVGLPGFFSHGYSKRVFDHAGSLLEISAGQIRSLGARNYSDQVLLEEVARTPPTTKIRYSYQPGTFEQQTTSQTGGAFGFRTEPPTNAARWTVNEAGWREWPTELAVYRLTDSSNTNAPAFYQNRSLHSPRWVQHNPHFPGITNVWTEWTATELDESQKKLFDSTTIFNAEGQSSYYVAHKVNSHRVAANRIVYQLPEPRGQDWQLLGQAQAGRFQTNLSSPRDLSGSDFVGFYLDGPGAAAVSIQFKDASGRLVEVRNELNANENGNIAFWPLGGSEVQWLPSEIAPERGSAVGAPRWLVNRGNAFVVSVAELARAGLDPQNVSSITLMLTNSSPGLLRITRLFQMLSGDPFVRADAGPGFGYKHRSHSNGLEESLRNRNASTSGVAQPNTGWNTALQYQHIPVASINPSPDPPYYPVLLLSDHANPESPRPLYSLAAEDGRFVHYFETLYSAETKVYTVANGFDTPKLEVYRQQILDDENSPGILALGYGYYVTVPLSKARGGMGAALAALHNRCVASAFALGAERLAKQFLTSPEPRSSAGQLNRQHRAAAVQAAEINRLPTLAEAILPSRPAPWLGATTVGPAPDFTGYRTNAYRDFLFLSEPFLTETGLLPTSPQTQVARYVDTVQEADIIELAIKLGRPPLRKLAGELLGFYCDKSQGGTNLLHAFYDARTGASLRKRTENTRASDAAMTAPAQLAIAQAALCLGATGDTNALQFGKNLLGLLLQQFRSTTNEATWPRGIAETPVHRSTSVHGLRTWTEARTFSVASNARAYLLLKRLADQPALYQLEPKWQGLVAEAVQEQQAWLTNQVLPFVQSTGVVPKGLFEIQDIEGEQTALALDRWTTTEGWLAFIEAGDQIGIRRDLTRAWLENLARAHGVTINGVWGLDWTIAVGRPDSISPDLTARFYRVAGLLEDRPAQQFAAQSLSRLHEGLSWPAVLTVGVAGSVLKTGQGETIYPLENSRSPTRPNPTTGSWPRTMGVYAELQGTAWFANRQTSNVMPVTRGTPRDITQFFWTAAGFYLSIIAATLFWWSLSFLRRRRRTVAATAMSPGLLVASEVMQKAEERWAKAVLGLRIPAGQERTRYSNAAIEQNFHIQLRAIYKLVLEWRRVVNGWTQTDPRLTDSGEDPWINGMDEFAVMVGIYSRWVVKAGHKDGAPKADVLQEQEDSNHIWSRLVMYFSESLLRLLGLLKEFKANPGAAAVLGVNDQVELVLRTMGMRPRSQPFDARALFDAPSGPSAMDLLLIQQPGASLNGIVAEMETKLGIPREHVVSFIRGYKSFKEREQLYPIHPYVLEAAKMLPHFLLMGLVALIWYNNDLRGLKIFGYLTESASRMAVDWHSLIWAVPLFAGFGLSAIARAMQVYRYRWAAQPRHKLPFALDADITSLFGARTQIATPALRPEGWWNPVLYQRAGWVFRALGLAFLAFALFQLEAPSFVTFMFVKGLLGMVLLMESACLLGPLLISHLSTWLQERVMGHPHSSRFVRWLNQLNLVATRPASLLWLSIKYHFQPSVPTGGALAMIKAITFYLLFAAVFFVIGSYMFEQALEVWFRDAYGTGRDFGLLLGAFLFWNTMYLLRFGLFVLMAGISSAATIHPFKVAGAAAAGLCLAIGFLSDSFKGILTAHPIATAAVFLTVLALMFFESEVLAWLGTRSLIGGRKRRLEQQQNQALEQFRSDPNRAFAIVYMSGDDLSFHKLTPELLLSRLKTLRDQLGSRGVDLLSEFNEFPNDTLVAQWFGRLYELEKKQDTTLWHPIQLVVDGQPPQLSPELGLNLPIATVEQKNELLRAWHLRRWLVTMMSTAGHSQDTAINLVDIALALHSERLGGNSVFYLIQNKYDNNDNNRPSQVPYDKGELAQRNKLARLLMETAPGSRAYSINDWTPFGFKAGGLVGMDLVYEESLRLTNMLLLDRNATANDVEAVMSDLKLALADPGVVIVLPGRSTTNTLTPIGQSSQLVEEGQRALVRGVMALGGTGGESLGTGWGNIQAVYYGRVQKALCDLNTPKMPLTTPAERGASFGDRYEGLIGFGPHAIGISEDIWGVTQAAHNALGLGYSIRFERSKALWHKIRETWSHAEWLAAFPRWSGGYVQMMLDPMMQRINDAGPLSVFAKEIRANGGRYFLGAPAALLSILLMPLAIIGNVSPFVQILILLWNLGLVMNQIMTALGFVAYLEGAGFNRFYGLAGLFVAGLASAWSRSSIATLVPLLALGFLAGGFALGLGRWLFYRGRDLVLFGPQLIIHALGQLVRQSLEFVLSGASANDAKAVNMAFRAWVGPREDRPFEKYQNFVNLRTAVWIVGLASLLLDLFALANLDFLNVLLLLPSLMFSVSALVGPFLMQPKPGKDLGWTAAAPKALGWLCSFCFYMLVASLIARGGWPQWFGVTLCVAVFARAAWIGLRYLGYSQKLRKATESLSEQMATEGLAPIEAQKLSVHIVRSLLADIEKTKATLQKSGLPTNGQETILKIVQQKVLPLIKQPLTDLEPKSRINPRWWCEWSRSFVLGLFTFVWFFVVPMPGLLVFTAPGGSRISLAPGTLFRGAVSLIGMVLVAYLVSRVLDWWERNRTGGSGLTAQIRTRYQAFEALSGSLTPMQSSQLYAMFTDVQTYFDQQSYAYARATLKAIDQILKGATDPNSSLPSSRRSG